MYAATKKAARQEAKMEKAEKRKAEEAGIEPGDETAADGASEEANLTRLNELLNSQK